MKTEKITFTEPILRKMAANPAHRGHDFTDAGCANLVIYIAKNGVVTFTFRKRVKGAPKGRIFEGLAPWSSAFTLAQARDACAVRRTEIAQHGLKPKAEKKTVLESFPMYEKARANKDQQASRRRAPLAKKWKEHSTRFKSIFKDLMGVDVNRLERKDFTNCMDNYGEQWAKENDRDWDPRVLRPMMVCMMPMLNWYTKRFRLDPREVADLVPPDYDPDKRYLLPGEWQACAPHIDALDGLSADCGLFERFVLYTCVRSEQALRMQWDDLRWGQWKFWKDADGREHRALIWVPPRKTAKGRDGEGKEELPRRVLLTEDSLAVLEKLRAIWEANVKLPEHAHWNGVFPERVVHRWRTARTEMQRGIEKAGGTKPWDRMTLRHTHASYLKHLGCPARLVTMSMNHTPDDEGSARITKRYSGNDPARMFMENDPLAELAPWHARLHKLFRDIERGNVHSPDLAMVTDILRDDQQVADMCHPEDGYGIPRRFIEVVPTKLAAVK